MPSITLTLTDTPNGAVSIHSSFRPAVGAPCSPPQAAALEMISRTHREWGMQPDTAPGGIVMTELGCLLAGRKPGFCTDVEG